MQWRWVRVSVLLLFVVLLLLLLLVDRRGASAEEVEIPASLSDAVSEALIAWEGFASTGDTAALEPVFVVGGPQYRLLDGESSAWNGTDSLEPFRFTIRELDLRTVGPELATVWVRVEATRIGFESQTLSWDFDLIRRDGRWKVWTVLAAERPEAGSTTVEPGSEPAVTSTTATTAAPDTDTAEKAASAAQPFDSGSSKADVRLPALSAWIIVITVVSVALAGYLAPRLDRRGEK